MAYIFLLENDNEIIASRREVLMQRSKLVDEVWFLVNPKYKTCENDMSVFSVMLEYILPTSKSYHSLELVQEKEGYKEYLKYIVPLDSNLSSEAGDIQLQLSFVYVGLDADGKGVQKVRKTKPASLHITPIAAWGDIIPDASLAAIDQRIIKTQAQIKELGYYAEIISENQVNNLAYDDISETLQLMAGNKGVGNKVSVRDMLDDGIPVVDLGSESGDSSENNNKDCDCGCEDNVVEFGDVISANPNDDNNVVEF
jgi:hypothetical protein